MKRTTLILLGLLASPTLFVNAAPEAGSPTPVPLRYTVAAGQTNVYSLQLEVQGEAGREVIGGTAIIALTNLDAHWLGLTMRTQLRPKPVPGAPFMGYRPGSPMPLSSYLSGPQGEPRELIVDERGQVIRQAGDLALPVPLGQLLLSLVQKFPAEPSSGWEDDEEVYILDEPLLQGPAPAFFGQSGGYPYMGYFPGRSPQGVLAARKKTKVRVTDATPQTVTLQRTFSLDSRMLTGSEPRVSASGEGQIIIDRASGWPKKLDLECKAVAVTQNLSRRSVLALHWQLLEGAERLAVLAPPPPRPAEEAKLSPADISKLMQELKSDDLFTRQSAARTLESPRLDKPSPELLALVTTLAADRDDTVRQAALNVLASHGTKEHLPLLLKALKESDNAQARLAIVKGLGRLKDPRAAEPLADLLATGRADPSYSRPPRDSQITDALIQLGPAAETAVLGVLKEKNIDTRCQACAVLKQIGTKKSLTVLRELTGYPSKELSEAAADACRSIQARLPD